jgi:Ca-activated chloride channel family protein
MKITGRLAAVGPLNLSSLVAFVSAVSYGQDSGSQRPQFRVSVEMVSLSVTVFDEDRRLVTDLGVEDFNVYEDGAPQEIKIFSREALPLRMVILLDTSSSIERRLALAQEAAVRFVDSLQPGDQVKIIEFNDRVLALTDFTPDFAEAKEAIRSTKAQGATSLYEALYISLRSFSRQRDGNERLAVVVLSDGNDTRSLVTFDDVRDLARKTDVLVYTISLRGQEDDLRKQKYADAKYELEKLSVETGGSSFAPAGIDDLAGVYERIAAELKSQYNIGYVSTNAKTDGSWRRLQVMCDQEGTEVRSRVGYYAPRM